MNRRYFIRIAGLSGASLVAIPSLGYVSTSTADAAVGAIMNEFSYLKLEKKGVEQFVQDYFKGHYINSSIKSQLNLKTCYYLGIKSEKSRLISEIVTHYMACTDFFMNKMDESKPVKYLGLNIAYTSPCSNAFSFLYYPSDVA